MDGLIGLETIKALKDSGMKDRNFAFNTQQVDKIYEELGEAKQILSNEEVI